MIPLLAALITLETDATRIGFDPARNGAIVSLVDKASGAEFAAPAATPLLYELRFTNAPPSATLVTDADAEGVTVKREGGEVVITAPRHKNAAVSVECRFRAPRGSPLVHGRIAVRGAEKFTLAAARFPALAWRKQPGGPPEREFLALPRNDGCLIQTPGTRGSLPVSPYPGSASMQFVACYDDTAGLYAACHDSQAFTKQIGVEKGRDSLRLAFLHYPAREPRREWRLEYDVVLGTFRGDWQTAADLYKSWAVHQPWCRRTLAGRVKSGDVPRWLAGPSLFYAYSLRGMDDKQQWINRLPLAPRQAGAWRELLGGPVTFMLMAWEKEGPWVTPDYFPPFGGENDFKTATAALHAAGHRTLVFLSGLKWTLRKTQGADAPFDDTAEFERRGAASAICGTDGRPQKWGAPDRDVGEHAQICAATALGRKILTDSSLECQRLGIDCVQADQIVGGGLPPCHSATHGHPPGGGNWCAAALYKIFAGIRREGKKRDRDFAFAIEEPNEFFIQVLDTCHTRDYQQGRWPRDGAGVIGVPLFTHVYHEFAHGYGGDSCGITTNASPAALYQQAMNLVCGKTPGVAVWTRPYDPAATHPSQARMLRSHFELWNSPAREFLVFGRRVATPDLKVPAVRLRFWGGTGRPSRELDTPAVLHSAWRLPDGREGAVFACVADETVAFDAGGTPLALQPGEAKFVERRMP